MSHHPSFVEEKLKVNDLYHHPKNPLQEREKVDRFYCFMHVMTKNVTVRNTLMASKYCNGLTWMFFLAILELS